MFDPNPREVFAVLPAAGTGERTGLKTPKQFYKLAGYPLILHTLWNFQRPWIAETVVAVSEDWLPYLQELISLHSLQNVHLVIGGQTRHRSIRICLRYVCERVQNEGCDSSDVTVIVHDAVRPFVAEETLRSVAEAAKKHGAAGVVCPLVSTTLATRHDGTLDYSLLRSKHCNSLTPQAFSYNTIVTAYDKISEDDLDHGTEVLHLALEYAGVRAKLLETKDEVWKVTYRRDICAAEQFARERLAKVAILSEKTSGEVIDILEEHLKKKRLTLLSKCTSLSTLPTDANAIIIYLDILTTDQYMSYIATVTERLKEQLHPCKGSLSLLVTMPTDERTAKDDLMARFRELRSAETYRDICLYCVILERKNSTIHQDRTERACELIAKMVLQQDELMSGQTFIV